MFYAIIVGSRSFTDYDFLKAKCDALLINQKEVTVVSGGSRGADYFAKCYATQRGYQYKEFKANWDLFGASAGYIRNEEMHRFVSQFPDRGCIAFWDGESKGTQHNFMLAEKYHNPIRIIEFNNGG